MANYHILKNLHSLIRNSALTYSNEFVWQDIELTDEFKKAYARYLENSKYDIEFLGATAVITSPSSKYIYVPNQWFVIASYAVDVYEELQRYKGFFKKVAEIMNKRPDAYAKVLRDSASSSDKTAFLSCATSIFSTMSNDEKLVEESASRLWRFVNDYAWWSGQKTIDRGDFYVSVVLNMLNLVNVSQGYVADIVNAYSSDYELRKLVINPDGFTVNMIGWEKTEEKDYILPDEEIRNESTRSSAETLETIPKPERVRIKISGSNSLKEIKFKG